MERTEAFTGLKKNVELVEISTRSRERFTFAVMLARFDRCIFSLYTQIELHGSFRMKRGIGYHSNMIATFARHAKNIQHGQANRVSQVSKPTSGVHTFEQFGVSLGAMIDTATGSRSPS